MAKEQSLKRHDIVCVRLDFNICKETEVRLHNEQFCEHVPKSFETIREGNHTMEPKRANRQNNKPDVCDTEK
jgi:hypothetical protein